MEFLKHQINRLDREYFIEKVNKPLEKAIIILGNRFPEPTRLNCFHPNSHRLFDIRDEFFKRDNNRTKKVLLEVLFRILIAKYEHSPYYAHRFDWFIEKINESGWKSRPNSTQCWSVK